MSDDRCHRCDRAECRADDLRRLWQAASSGSDEEARAGLALDAANADCRAHEVTREQWRTRALTAEREAERLRHGTTIEVTAEQIVDAWDAAAGGPYSLPSAAVRAAVERFIGARIVAAKNAPPSGPTPTTFECRVCSRQVGGMSDGAFDEQGWSRIERIDGPDAICPTCKRPVNLTGTYNPETECGEHEGSLTCRLFARALTAEREAERLRKEVEAVRARWDADTVSEDDTDGRDTDALLRCIGIDLRAALAQGADR